MKKLLLIAAVAMSTVSFAQSGAKEDLEIIQSIYGKDKKDLVSEYMKLEEPKAAEFWKMYDAYELDRKALGQKKLQLLEDYAKNYETLTDEKADELAVATLKNNEAYNKLNSKYYKKAKKIVGALNAAKFMQLETALQTAVRNEIQSSVPFIGEIERTKKH